MMQMEFIQERFQLLLLLRPAEPGHLQHGLDIIFHTQLAEYGGFLGQVSDAHLRPLIHRKTGDIDIVQEHIALVGLDQSDYHIEGCGLSGSIGTQ